MKSPFDPRAAAMPLLALALAVAGCPASDGSCESSALCAPGTHCFDGACVATLPAGSFTPPGNRTITNAGTTSAPYPSTCTATTAPAAGPSASLPAGWALDLGTHLVGETIPFTVPAGTASVTIHLQGVSATSSVDFGTDLAPNYVVPARVLLPNGNELYEFAEAFGTRLDPSLSSGYFAPNPWTASFTVPSSHRFSDLALAQGALPAGTWQVTLADLQSECDLFGGCYFATPGSYRVTVIAKPGPYASTGRLGVAFYFASTSVTATTASGAQLAAYQRFVNGIDRLLNQAGIAIDDVAFYDLPAGAPAAFSITDINGLPPCDEMSRLFSLADPAFDGVHVFLVDQLVSGTSGVVGLTGSIPGPTGMPGAVTGGIVTSLTDIDLDRVNLSGTVVGTCGAAFDLLCNADFAAYVTAHEIGHWLGLYHPTEATGELYDPLADTETCGCGECSTWGCPAPYPPGMAASICMAEAASCGGGKNLMFWQVDPSRSRGDLTFEQGFVMRANPGVRWVAP